MTQNPACCTPDMSLQEVARMMVECDCGAIPVVDGSDSNQPIGIVTDRDIVVRVLAKGMNPMECRVRDAMTEEVVCVSQDADLDEATHLMEEHQIRRILVTSNGHGIVGILAQADVALEGTDHETGDVVQSISQPSGTGNASRMNR
jgi:CBS domain-containing protein